MIVSGWALLVIAGPLQAELVINIAIKWNQRRIKAKSLNRKDNKINHANFVCFEAF